MAQRKKQDRKKEPKFAEPAESRRAETLTSLWMLAAVNALACVVIWIGLRVYVRNVPDAKLAVLLAGLLLVVAMILGVAILVLTPIVHRARRVAPPRAVTVGVVMIAIAPWAAAATLAVVQ